MKMADVRKYIKAGLTDDQIMALAKSEKEKGSGGNDGDACNNGGNEGDAGGKGTNEEILTAIKALTETIQASNLAGVRGREPETIDDILGTILFDDESEGGNK